MRRNNFFEDEQDQWFGIVRREPGTLRPDQNVAYGRNKGLTRVLQRRVVKRASENFNLGKSFLLVAFKKNQVDMVEIAPDKGFDRSVFSCFPDEADAARGRRHRKPIFRRRFGR